jgi:hypothetical protein
MLLHRVPRRALLTGAIGTMLATVLVACSTPAGGPPAGTGFAGYKWTIVSISHDGTITPVPAAAKYALYLQFTPDGHFGANDPVNYHSGSYQVTQGGFTTSSLMNTAMGYIGHDPVILLSRSAVSAFDDAANAKAGVSGNTLTVSVGGYTLTAQRDGRQANF